MNRLNALKEKLATQAAYLLPKSVAYWAFIRVATFECTGNPAEQSCREAVDRWKDPARARANFLGPAFEANRLELIRRKEETNQDPVHVFDGLCYFWDETFSERLGPYSTADRARAACLAYNEWRQREDVNEAPPPGFEPDVPPSDPRHPWNRDFTQSFDGTDWAKAFIKILRFSGDGENLATDEAFMTGWFANAIMRGYDQNTLDNAPALEASPEAHQ